MMDPRELFARSVEQAWHCLRHVREDQLHNDTPCSEWDLRMLMNHMVYELLWMPDLLYGKTIAEVGDRYEGDVLRSDHHSAWQHAADAALVAVKSVELDKPVHLSRGEVSAKDYIMEVANDLFIHAWDASQSVNSTLLLNEQMAQDFHDFLLPSVEGYRKSGSYGPAVEVANDADIVTKLLALTGRRAPEITAV